MKQRRRTRRRLLSALLCVAVLFSLCLQTAFAEEANTNTLQNQINSANSGDTITLTQDYTESISIPKNMSITINLNNHTITATANGEHAITNNGTLTVTGSGTVNGSSYETAGAIYNAPGATANLNGGTFTGSKWYVIKNLGTMTIDGATVTQGDAGSSGIDNGYYGNQTNDCGVSEPESASVSLTIKSGTLSGGMNTVKNDDFGNLTITGGTYSNTAGPLVMNWNVASISGGKFTSTATGKSVVANGYCNSAKDVGQLTISGGTFTAASNGTGALFGKNEGATNNSGSLTISGGTFWGTLGASGSYPYTVAISGGTFPTDPSAYLVSGYSAPKVANIYVVHQHSWDAGTVTTAATTEAEGVKTYTCSVCGTTKTESVAKLDVVKAKTEVGEGAPATTIATPAEELQASINQPAEVSQALADSTKSVTENISLKVDKVTPDSTTAAEVVKKLGTTETQANVVYLDLNLSYSYTIKDVNGNVTNSGSNAVTETTKPITITIARPADLPKGDNIGYQIVRVHKNADGTYSYDILSGVSYDAATDTISFATDKFSTYAVAAHTHTWDAGTVTTVATTTKDGVRTYTCTTCGATKTETIPKLASTAVKTGDNNMTIWYLLLAGFAGVELMLCAVDRRKKVRR